MLAGLTLFGKDFVNESINGWIMELSDRSALWTAPGPTALRTMVGWNLEIMFMFAIAGIVISSIRLVFEVIYLGVVISLATGNAHY